MSRVNKIAIIVVTYNGENWLDKCISPLYDLENIKFIIIDNASSDNTVHNIKNNFPNVHLIESSKNIGFGQANNKGFEYAIYHDFEYVFLLNQDASIDLNNLKKLIEISQKNLDFGIISPIHFKNVNEIENVFYDYLLSNSLINNIKSSVVKEISFVNAALWLIPINVLKKVGGFNPLFFHYGEDVDYTNRVLYKGFKVVVCFDVKAFHYRNYSKKEFKKQFKKDTYFGPWNIKYFTVLSDINLSFLNVLLKSFYLFIISFVKYFMKGYFKASVMTVKVYFQVIYKILFIRKNRQIIKNKEIPFLNIIDEPIS